MCMLYVYATTYNMSAAKHAQDWKEGTNTYLAERNSHRSCRTSGDLSRRPTEPWRLPAALVQPWLLRLPFCHQSHQLLHAYDDDLYRLRRSTTASGRLLSHKIYFSHRMYSSFLLIFELLKISNKNAEAMKKNEDFPPPNATPSIMCSSSVP